MTPAQLATHAAYLAAHSLTNGAKPMTDQTTHHESPPRAVHPRQRTQPTPRDLHAALLRLYQASAAGFHRYGDGTLGRTEYEAAMKEARQALQAYAWGDDSHLPALPSVCQEPPIAYAEGEVHP